MSRLCPGDGLVQPDTDTHIYGHSATLAASIQLADAIGHDEHLPPKPIAPPRCPACQLQLCKGRGEPPHAALKVEEGGNKLSSSDTVYLCGVCAAVMVRSGDLMLPGWRQRR